MRKLLTDLLKERLQLLVKIEIDDIGVGRSKI